jgi:iron(III) transport system ATP-binding protein
MPEMGERGSVRFENVIKKYGEVTAIKGLSLEINPGELVTLLGPSGCGKTTTLRLIAGLESASGGSVHIGGKDVTHLSATYRNVAMVFQSYALFPHMCVIENVAYGLTVTGVPKKQARENAEEGLAMVGLAGYGDRLPSELSGGQQQRVAVARAVVLEPEVLLFDEPLSNLDAKLRRHVREEIRQIQQKLGMTAVYVTHDQEEAMAVSDRIVVMRNAEIAQQGSPKDLYERPNSEFIADFIGDANILPCELLEIGDGQAIVRLAGIQMNANTYRRDLSAARLVAHPQSITLSTDRSDGAVPGHVLHSAYLGNQMQYTVGTEVGEIFVIDNVMRDRFVRDDSVFVHFEDKKLALVPA